jgi:predicted DNA-binding transcriptional regulator AlpA
MTTELVPAVKVAAEFNVSRRTIGNWILQPTIGFPQPININNRMYFRRPELEAWKISRSVASLKMSGS